MGHTFTTGERVQHNSKPGVLLGTVEFGDQTGANVTEPDGSRAWFDRSDIAPLVGDAERDAAEWAERKASMRRELALLRAPDERDRALIAEREAARRKLTEPITGDYVEFTDGVVRRIAETWDGQSIQTTAGGSFHFGNGHMNYSGSLFRPVPRDTLTDTGTTRDASAWMFHHDFRTRDNGRDFVTPVRVWTCSLPAPE